MGMLKSSESMTVNDKSNYLRHSIDDQYSHNLRFGAMCNATWLTQDSRNKFGSRIYYLLETDKYMEKGGAQANMEIRRILSPQQSYIQ